MAPTAFRILSILLMHIKDTSASKSEELWDEDNVEYALLKEDWEQLDCDILKKI